ncbi:unnamed protein product [Heterobilharzia americana]|nr:unnamed protein product [Heterobilharzia americana]
MRQKSLESKVKSMSNHLVTSLANPLSSKVDEWRRNLCLLEKDRARQTKRVRAELKKALAEAQKWEKKAAKIGISGSGGVGPGVGHGIIPSPNLGCSNSESNAVNTQAAKAAREVGIKKELVENTEKSAIRLLLLEERSRFCFFVSCLLPILECQSSMLNEIATMDELIQSLTKETEYPNQLVEDVESIVLRMGRRDISVSSRASSKTISVFLPDTGGKMGNMNDILGGLFLTNNNRNCVNSSDTESGRHCTDMLPFHLRRESNSVGRCNSVCDSGDVSLCGASSHSGSGGSNCPSLLSPVRSNIAHLGSRESSLISVDSAASGSGNANPSYSIGMSNANVPHSDSEETQFKTLCRPGHYRAASNGDSDFSKHLKSGFRHHNRGDSMIAKSMIAFNPQSELSENLTTTDDQSCPTKGSEHDVDSVGGDKSENDDVNKLDVNTGLDRDDSNGDDDDDDDNDVGDEDEGEYVAVGNDSSGNASCLPDDSTSQALSNSANQHFPLDNYALSTSSGPPVPNSGRHTISSAYERGCHAPTRAPIMALSFNPPVGKASSKDSGVDSSAVLYPKQAVPPPVYTNLTQLAHAAQRKFSMSQLPIIHSYENVDNTTLERLRYAKNDIKATCHHYPHQQMHHNSMSTNTTQNQAMHSTQNGNYTNWSASGSLNKLHVNDSGLNPSRGGEQYTDPSALLQNQIDKLSSNTSLSSSCFSSKHHLDNVPGPDGGTITTVSNLPGHQTNGTDPFSIEMEELDQVMPGSSRGSSLTMASSTTNDSLPSSNGSPALVSYHANARRSVSSNPPYSQNSLVSEQSLENKLHYATPVVKNSSQCSASQMSNLMRHSTLVSNQVCINNQANSYTGYETKDISNGNLSSTSPPPPPPPPPPLPIFSNQLSKPTVPSSHSSLELNPSNSPCYTVKSAASSDLVSVETANLMSELSSQLQQLAARTNDIRFSPSKTNPISTDVSDEHNKECVRYDEFDLPPPPPSSMFTEQCYTSSQHKQGYSVNQLATDTTTASTTDSTGGQEESDTNLSPFLLALKQSVKQRADRLANQNSMIN